MAAGLLAGCRLRVYGAADANRARVRGRADDTNSATRDRVFFTTAYHAGACVYVSWAACFIQYKSTRGFAYSALR
eukprot:4179721-Prymnesium_polylepis.1